MPPIQRSAKIPGSEIGLEARHAAFVAQRQITPWPAKEPIRIYVNHGRWVGDCSCNSGIALADDHSRGYCFGCGAIYTHIVIPPDAREIERVLEMRPGFQHQNWSPSESLDELKRENNVHGLAVGKER